MDTFRDPHTDVGVTISELLVATADSSDALVDGSVNEVLHAMREKMALDVVFVSEFVDGRRVFRHVDGNGQGPDIRAGDSDPLEATFCQRVVDGRLGELTGDIGSLPASAGLPATPFRVGAHLSTPIVLKDGRTYGTLCCFSTTPNPLLQQSDLQMLRQCAQLVARKLEFAEARGLKEPPAEWKLEPIGTEKYESTVWKLP